MTLEHLKQKTKQYSEAFRRVQTLDRRYKVMNVSFEPFLSEPIDQSLENIFSPPIEELAVDENQQVSIDLAKIDAELNATNESTCNYAGKCSIYFQRQLNQQYRDIAARRQQIIDLFGEINNEYEDMQVEAAAESCKSGPTASNYCSQRKQYNLTNRERGANIRMSFIDEDYSKLMPGNYLNDTLIQNYLQIVNTFMVPPQQHKTAHIFSTYLLEKLLKDMVDNSLVDASYFYTDEAASMARRTVCENYPRVQRWTRKQDIFKYQIIVFPINMFLHWFCVLVINPGSLISSAPTKNQQCQLVFCDSMFQQRSFVVEAIYTYLQLQLLDKKKVSIKVSSSNAPCFQLLLPRQTNTHDCGLYMLGYIEELLINRKKHLAGLADICNRLQLRLFPRVYLQSFRHRMMKLLIKLYKQQVPELTEAIIDEYLAERNSFFSPGYKTDSETMEAKEFQKFSAIVRASGEGELEEEEYFGLLVKFNLISEINYYEAEVVRDAVGKEDSDSDFM